MNLRHVLDMLLLAALWGGSFLFMRVAVPEFGAIPLIELRAVIAAVFLLMILRLRRKTVQVTGFKLRLTIVGVFNVALPFTLLAYALLSLSSGTGSILNATTPMFSAIIAYLWLGEQLTRTRTLGLLVGFIGVLILVSDKLGLHGSDFGLPIAAALVATCSYGFAANYVRKNLQGVDPLLTSSGSQIVAALVLLPAAIIYWPDTMPSLTAWLNLLVLGVASTGVAFIIYFRLISEIGAARATTVTFLIPVFGTAAGIVFLGEQVTLLMLVGAGVIILGTALSSGLLKLEGLERAATRL